MDHLSTEEAFREFFATRLEACRNLTASLMAADACDEHLSYELLIIQQRSGILLKFDMQTALRRHVRAEKGADGKQKRDLAPA